MNNNEYILHHLAHLEVGRGSFWTIHLDSLLVSLLTAGLLLIGMNSVLRKPKLQPSFWQNLWEFVFCSIYKEVKEAAPKHVDVIGPLAFSLFLSILAMNLMDLLPVDLALITSHFLGVETPFKIVPTADINITVGLALSSFIIIHYYAVKKNGIGCFIKTVLTHPFGGALFPVNILLRIIEEFSRIISLSMRLFGNMFAGELIFILLAALPPLFVEVPAVIAWSSFHIFIVILQAFIFTMLTVVNFSLALEHD
jgi:F-type H+-transporting ATPase subunit a